MIKRCISTGLMLARLIVIFIMIVVYFIVYSRGAEAITQDQIRAFESNVHYFNTEADAQVCKGGSGLTGGDNEQKTWNYLLSKGLSPAQAAGFMGNMQAEAHFEPKLVEYGHLNSRGEISVQGQPSSLDDNVPQDDNSNGQPGYGIVQWSGGRKPPLRDAAAAAGVLASDLQLQLDNLWRELTTSYNSSVYEPLKATNDVNEAARIVLTNFEVPADIPGQTPVRQGMANDILQSYGSGSTPSPSGTSPSSASGCSSTNGVVAGSILKTALGLAWPDSGHGVGCAAATPAYQAARAQFVPEDPTGCTGCDVFLSTVMQASGVDPNYTHLQTSQQLIYVKAHPEKFQILGETTGNSLDPKLQPGDILINGDIATGHTLVYTGDQPNGSNMVDGSNTQHVPQPNHWGGGGWVGTYSIVRVLN